MKIKAFVKRLLCFHEWGMQIKRGNPFTSDDVYVCVKCGKKIIKAIEEKK